MHAIVLLCIYQHLKLEVPSFTDSKDIIGQNFEKRVTWPWLRPLWVVWHR